MYQYHKILFLLVVMSLLTACTQSAPTTNLVSETAVAVPATPEATAVVATDVPAPTATPVPPTATPEPITGVAALTSFASMPIKMLWSDTFDDTTSGWEPRYEGPKVALGPAPYNAYVDGTYEFSVRQYFESAFLWDFNGTQALPNYPYSVFAEVVAQRDGYAVLFVDYQGDFGRVDASSGIAVVFSLKEAETTLGPDFSSDSGSDVAVYEFRSGATWNLNCDTSGEWPEVRTAVVAVHVDADRIGVEIAPSATGSARATKTCARVQPVRNAGNAHVGIGALHASPFELYRGSNDAYASDVGVIRFQTMAIAQRDTPLDWTGGNTKPEQLIEYSCVESDTRRLISNELRSYYGYDSRQCDPAIRWDGETYPLEIVPYEANVDELIGNWQCGNDAENRIAITRRGDFLQLANMYDSYGMVYVTSDFDPERGKHFLVSDVFLVRGKDYVRSTDELAVGMRMFYTRLGRNDTFSTLALVYRDGQLKSNWAGDCTRIP